MPIYAQVGTAFFLSLPLMYMVGNLVLKQKSRLKNYIKVWSQIKEEENLSLPSRILFKSLFILDRPAGVSPKKNSIKFIKDRLFEVRCKGNTTPNYYLSLVLNFS